MDRYSAVSQYSDPGDMIKTPLLRRTKASATPKAVDIVYDRWCAFDGARSLAPISAEFPPVNAWIVKDVVVSRSYIAHKGAQLYVDTSIDSGAYLGKCEGQIVSAFSKELSAAKTDIDERYKDDQILVLHNEGGGTWGHFLVQDVPKVSLYLSLFPAGKIALPPNQCKIGHSSHADAMAACGAIQDQIVSFDPELNYKVGEAVFIDMLYAFEQQSPHPFALEVFKNIKDKRPIGGSGRTYRNFVQRTGSINNRIISNQNELDEILEHFAFEKFISGVSSFERQLSRWAGSAFNAAVLGSDLANMVFAASGSTIISLSPDWFGDLFFYNLAAFMELEWKELRCGRRTGEHAIQHRSDFLVDGDLVRRCLAKWTD